MRHIKSVSRLNETRPQMAQMQANPLFVFIVNLFNLIFGGAAPGSGAYCNYFADLGKTTPSCSD